jgi:glycosyltransferase involved in cell wall biosynthesis
MSNNDGPPRMPFVVETAGDALERVEHALHAPQLSVVIPAYNSEACIRELTRRLQAELPAITEDYEIVFIEDGGEDGSWGIICDLAARDRRIRGLQFSRNFGQHFALTAGLDYAAGDWIVIMDCDLQDPPEFIKTLYTKALEGYDVVLARRITNGAAPSQPLTSKLFYRVFDYMTDTRSDPAIGAFRILSRRVRDAFVSMREESRYFGGLMQWMGFPSTSVDVPRAVRFAGTSTYTFRKRLALALPAILAFSNKPLLIVVNIGFLISAAALAFGILIALRKVLYGTPVEGWTSVIVSLYFLTGMIMVTLGVVGIYVGKVFEQTKARPLYIVRRTTFGA